MADRTMSNNKRRVIPRPPVQQKTDYNPLKLPLNSVDIIATVLPPLVKPRERPERPEIPPQGIHTRCGSLRNSWEVWGGKVSQERIDGIQPCRIRPAVVPRSQCTPGIWSGQ